MLAIYLLQFCFLGLSTIFLIYVLHCPDLCMPLSSLCYSGASSDFQQATAVARGMVSRFGMSDKIGPVLHTLEPNSDISPETRHVIEAEVKRFLQVCYITRSLIVTISTAAHAFESICFNQQHALC